MTTNNLPADYWTATPEPLPTELPEKCRFRFVWEAGTSHARTYWRTASTHDVEVSRFESGRTMWSCRRCGHAAMDY